MPLSRARGPLRSAVALWLDAEDSLYLYPDALRQGRYLNTGSGGIRLLEKTGHDGVYSTKIIEVRYGDIDLHGIV